MCSSVVNWAVFAKEDQETIDDSLFLYAELFCLLSMSNVYPYCVIAGCQTGTRGDSPSCHDGLL